MDRILVFCCSLVLVSAALGACSSSPNEGSPLADAGDENAPPDARPPIDDGSAPACEPIAKDRASKWKPPLPRQPNACSPAQLEGYVQSCLYQFETPAVCDAFKKQNTACAGCIDSNEGDTRWGPIVWFRDRMYFDLNTGGCVALVLSDESETGCGAAEGHYQDCARIACRGCVTGSAQTDRDALFACLDSRQMRTVCATETANINVACADYLKPGPDNPTTPCFVIDNESLESQVRRYITSWCSTPVDAGADAALDAGEDADAGQ